MSTNMKEIQFSKPTYEAWQEEATKALKGKPFESLFTKTIENITLSPLYTADTLFNQLGEQLEKQVATIRQSTNVERFATAQQIYGDSPQSFISQLEESLARGNEYIVIDSRQPFEWDQQTLQIVADYMTEYPFKLIVQNDEDALLKVFSSIDKEKLEAVQGFIVSAKPLTSIKYSNVRSVCADATKWHHEGANAVQELAYVLAFASEQLKNKSFEQFEKEFFVQFAMDTQFFTEIAKIRAFKVLWKAFTSAYGVDGASVPVVAETSVRSLSKLDMYVNLLRTGNAALSAAIAGVDAFTIHPHDVLTKPTEQSIRIARNVSLITKEESHVLNVIDPAGGSYFVESLTADLVKEAWRLFIEITEAGGYFAYLQTFKQQVAKVQAEREHQVATRKASLIGTNIYANPTDVVSEYENERYQAIPRLAKPFEKLRETYQSLALSVEIIPYGELKKYKPRADYVAGVLAVAGIKAKVLDGFQSIDEMAQYVATTTAQYAVIVATDEDTTEIVPLLASAKKGNLILDVAGKFKEQEQLWQEQGINGFVYAGQNIVDKLTQIAQAVEEA